MTGFYDFHVFCCLNEREKGHKRGCCASKGADDLQQYFKERAKKLGLRRTRVNKSGCLDRCEFGAAIVIYPEGVWYQCHTRTDIDRIIESHLIGGVPVVELQMPGRGVAI